MFRKVNFGNSVIIMLSLLCFLHSLGGTVLYYSLVLCYNWQVPIQGSTPMGGG